MLPRYLSERRMKMDFRAELEKILNSNEQINDVDLQNYLTDIIAPNADKLPILYRFSPANEYSFHALENQTLYLSEVGSMNDIFEGLSCGTDDPLIENIEKLSDLVYLKSFSETKDDLKMWSMYADNYSGMCVAYDFHDIDDEFIYHLFPVCYSEKRKSKKHLEDAVRELQRLKKDIDEKKPFGSYSSIRNIMSLYLTKSMEWKNEKEWRIIVTYPQMHADIRKFPNKESHFFYELNDRNIYAPYATDIYLGPKMKSADKEKAREIAQRNNVCIHEMQLDEKMYALTEKTTSH